MNTFNAIQNFRRLVACHFFKFNIGYISQIYFMSAVAVIFFIIIVKDSVYHGVICHLGYAELLIGKNKKTTESEKTNASQRKRVSNDLLEFNNYFNKYLNQFHFII